METQWSAKHFHSRGIVTTIHNGEHCGLDRSSNIFRLQWTGHVAQRKQEIPHNFGEKTYGKAAVYKTKSEMQC